MSYRIQKEKKSSKLLSALNIPSRYHNVTSDGAYFSPILASWDKTKIVTPDKQAKWAKKIITQLKNNKPISSKILVHSRPTDDSAMRTAFSIMLSALDKGYSAKAYNLGFFSKNFENNSYLEYDVLVLYSLNTYSSDYKFDLVRDILRKADKSIVIVVSTCPKFGNEARSALDFNYEFINYRFNGYLQIDEIQ
jgi:hypothetical protein